MLGVCNHPYVRTGGIFFMLSMLKACVTKDFSLKYKSLGTLGVAILFKELSASKI